MAECAWCHKRFDSPVEHRQENPLCDALWTAQTEDAPLDVQQAAGVLYRYVNRDATSYCLRRLKLALAKAEGRL